MAPHVIPKLLPTGGLLLEASCRDLLYLPSNLGTGTTRLPRTPPWQTYPRDLVLTELALLGLGQGLPAPGPLMEGERDGDNEKVPSTPRGGASRGRVRGLK